MKKSFVRNLSNRVLHLMARFLPGGTSIRPMLHRLRGVKIHDNVFIGDDVYLENEYPECVEIHDGVQIGIRTTIIAHTRGPTRIIIEKNVFIGSNCVIVVSPGKTLTIGEGSVLGIASIINNDVPAHTFYSGEKAKQMAHVMTPFTSDTSYTKFLMGLRPLARKEH